MKKNVMTRTIAVMAAALVGVGAFAGCKSERKTGLEAYKDRPNKVSVVYRQNAYGKEWITQIAKEYMDKHNSDTYIDLDESGDASTEFSKVQSDSAFGDLYFFDQSLKDLKGHAEDVTDVWDSYAIGEEGTAGAKKIKDKLVPLLASQEDYYGVRNFSLPYSQATTYGWVYNKTVLDAAFPSGYTLPRTTDEVFAFGDALKTADIPGVEKDEYTTQEVYLLTCSLGDQNENLKYSQQTWFAQILGEEKYEKYFDGRYFDGTAYVFDETKPTVHSHYKTEILQFYDIISKLVTMNNGYLHRNSDALDYIYSSGTLVGAGYMANKSKVAFKVDGPYFESEAKTYLNGMKNKGQEQTLGMMAFPVASAIINRLPSINDDVTLRSVIDYVDGVTATAPAGVDTADIEEVRKARGMVGVYTGGGAVIPKTAANKDGAKDFLKYLCSDEAAVVSAKATNGLEILPYGKVVSDAELGFEKSNFIKEVSKWMTKNTYVTSSDAAFSTYTNFNIGESSGQLVYSIVAGRVKSGEDWWSSSHQTFTQNWNTYVTEYKMQGYKTTD